MKRSSSRRTPTRRYTTGTPQADAQIAQLLAPFEDDFDRTLLSEMVSSVYRLGVDHASTLDLKILNSALKELRYAFQVFQPYRHVRKVAVFGSARTARNQPAYAMAERFGSLMAQAHWMVITGAASGIMKAGHEGAGREASFGLNIRLPFEQEANPVIARDEKLVSCKYFFTRKLLFLKESHATVLFPGGFGTLDEGFETLTLVQTGKAEVRPILFVDLPHQRSYWKPLIQFMRQDMVRRGMVSADERSVFEVVHSAEEAAQYLKRFYSTYHSMRTVGNQLVLRTHRPLPTQAIKTLSKEFKDIMASGHIDQRGALAEEMEEQGDEPELAQMSRLVFKFNRRGYGRLIEMIHRINTLGVQ